LCIRGHRLNRDRGNPNPGRKICFWHLCYPSGTPWEGGTEQTKTKKRGLGGKLNALATALIFTSLTPSASAKKKKEKLKRKKTGPNASAVK
jgi:hypothetical protein